MMDTENEERIALKRTLDRALLLLLVLTAGSALSIVGHIFAVLAGHAGANLRAALLWGFLAAAIIAVAGAAARLVLVSQDRFAKLIDQYKDAQQAAEQQAEGLRRMGRTLTAGLESVPDAVIAADAGEFVVYLNPLAEKLTGWQAADAVGMPLSRIVTLVHSRTRAPVAPPATRSLQEYVPAQTEPHTLLIALTGLETVIDGVAQPIWDSEQRVVGVVFTLRDIGRQAAETEALRLAETRCQAVLETAMEAVVAADSRGIVTEVNPAAAALFGRPRAKIVGAPAADLLVFPIGRHANWAELAERLQSAESQDELPLEAAVRRSDGATLPVRLNAAATGGAGGRVLTLALQDLSEQKRLAADLQEASREAAAAGSVHSRFLANISDELRTPLNAVIGYSEILMEEADEQMKPEFRNDLQRIHDGGKHLLTLANHMLNLSKIDSQAAGLFLETFDVEPLMDEVAETVRPMLESSDNRLQIFYSGPAGQIQTDRTKLRQSLINALASAAKMTSFRTVTLVAARESAQDRNWITFRIADAASRLAPRQVSEFLETFPDSRVTTAKKSTDVGLALEVSRRLCRMMGGDLNVESRPGQGAMVVIRLPEDPGPSRPHPQPLSQEQG